ncbi:MAG: hypothetical protein BAJALOKI2v1_490017 [Promethearchaeota archaeon]|nr:MAG: hypothetical protein BAJALOKI2v1_490017 [Candidatus Lokiarchaeota archaeon]
MSEERLYQPDFSSIFGSSYANAFIYKNIDSLIYPVFSDIEKSEKLEKLLDLTDANERSYFYNRTISLEDELVELTCSNIKIGLIQAMDLGRDYGITNQDVLSAVKRRPDIFKAILSYDLSEINTLHPILNEIKEISRSIDVVGICLYPSYTKLDLSVDTNERLREFFNFCSEHNYFIKLDLGNFKLPNFSEGFISPEILKTLISHFKTNQFIVSGLDLSVDFHSYLSLQKYFDNLWIEIDPRTFGGMTPTGCFNQLFQTEGFIQNSWSKITIGSATPILEVSQMVKGFNESTETLNFPEKCLLRTWAFRNLNRINPKTFTIENDKNINLFATLRELKVEREVETNSEIDIFYKLKLRSYAITQLLFLTEIIKNVFERSKKEYPSYKDGELFLRSYHTTTSLIINEHEPGNYLDLHYKFAEISKKNNQPFLHTVHALENRADFNHYDHELASSFGNRQLIIPILNNQLEIGGRENFYVLVTFGPRTFSLLIRVKLYKT